MVINPQFIKVPSSWNVYRNTVQPKENYNKLSFGKSFDESYDYDVLFSGVIRNGDNVIITAPPFLNFKKFIEENVKITDGFNVVNFNFVDLDRCGVAVAKVSKEATHLYLNFKEEEPLKIKIETPQFEKFSNKKILFTMFKNDPKEWILNWIQYHNQVYGIDGFVLFNNNSDIYSSEDIEKYLSSNEYELDIVDWPMKWGIVGPPWDSDFCKIVALQYLKYNFAYESELVLNLDIDEYFVSEYPLDMIIESMIDNRKDSINMESKNISRYTLNTSNPQLKDYYWYHDEQIDLNKMVKWITLPKYSRQYCWSTHFIFSPNRDETDDFYYAHMSILTADHHIKNDTEIYKQRFEIKESENKENDTLRKNFNKMKNTMFINMN